MSELELILNSKPKLQLLTRSAPTASEKVLTKSKAIKSLASNKMTAKRGTSKIKQQKSKVFFEDFVFEEPPPDNYEANLLNTITATNEFKRDDEFWKFYENS